MKKKDDRVARVVVGIGALLLPLVLIYFSGAPELSCTRSAAGTVECRAAARALGLVRVGESVAKDVGAIVLLPPNEGGGTSFLRFSTRSGLRDLGYFSQRFIGDSDKLKEFLNDRSRRNIQLTKTLSGRAIFANILGVGIFLLGIVTLIGLLSPPKEEIDWEEYAREQNSRK